jgi:hypothetical protein
VVIGRHPIQVNDVAGLVCLCHLLTGQTVYENFALSHTHWKALGHTTTSLLPTLAAGRQPFQGYVMQCFKQLECLQVAA